MNPSAMADFLALLHAQREGLLARVRQQRNGDIGRADAAADARQSSEGDEASADAQRDLAVALEERELAELTAIGAALERVADGSYGTCTDCGTDIPAARLQAAPAALRCIGCQNQVETAHGGVNTPSM